MTSSERPPCIRLMHWIAAIGLLALSTASPAGTWIAAGAGGVQGNPGSRHGINVGGFTPARGTGLAVFPLLYSGDTASLLARADLNVGQAGPVEVNAELRRAVATLAVGNAGPDPVTDATLDVTISPAPEAVGWLCTGTGAQCIEIGSGGTVDGLALAVDDAFEVEFTIDFDAALPMPGFQVSGMIGSELDDPLTVDNTLTLTWSDVMFRDGFE